MDEEKCLNQSWIQFQTEFQLNSSQGYCNATWDSVFCWPFTPSGTTIKRPCAEVMKDSPEIHPEELLRITGDAIRICGENGSWIWGNWTNYNECLESLEETPNSSWSNSRVVDAVRYILFIGSILSFLCLAVSLFIFYYFKCLRCDRVKVHIHLMISLALRFVLLVFVTEPFIFNRSENYRKIDFVCKSVMSLLMYATVASINWMFIQGHYLHGRVTTNVFDKGTPFKIYYFIGWVLPLLLIFIWGTIMETYHPVHCWKNFSQQHYIWILVGPMIFALFINLVFLVNIMRILLTKIQRANTSNDAAQFRRAVKATVVLFPLLGINNLLFVYNPGGEYENVYMIANTLMQSSQGIFVSLLYCFISNDVRDAIRRQYRRYTARRSANSIRRQSHRRSNRLNNAPMLILTPLTDRLPDRTQNSSRYFRKKFNLGKNAKELTPSPDPVTSVFTENVLLESPIMSPVFKDPLKSSNK